METRASNFRIVEHGLKGFFVHILVQETEQLNLIQLCCASVGLYKIKKVNVWRSVDEQGYAMHNNIHRYSFNFPARFDSIEKARAFIKRITTPTVYHDVDLKTL